MLGILAAGLGIGPQLIWAPKGIADDADSFVAFRGKFRSSSQTSSMRILGASEYLVWLDGKLIHDGPARYPKGFPEYQEVPLAVSTGEHTLAVQVRNDGVTTRMLSAISPFLMCDVDGSTIRWKCARMPGYRPRTKRISEILGWIDWVDTRSSWTNWQGSSFDEKGWLDPVSVDPGIGPIEKAKVRPVRLNPIGIKASSSGSFATTYGYENDDPAARFFLDDLAPKGIPGQGVWRRYDLGRVRLGRPKLTLDLPAGSVVEYAMSEQLAHGRVQPWITLSGSASCNFDHFVARGGVQEFMPFTPKGGRFLEVHVKSSGQVKFVNETFLERTYYGEPVGSFECDDPLLNKIWRVGVNTVQACADDTLVDCPTRERGQWTGDVASVATDICAVAFGDLSLSRRALVQAAQAARSDGLVAGVGPGDPGYLSTYAAQWVTACVHFYDLTKDLNLLQELYEPAKKNMAAFRAHWHKDGLDGNLGWGFVDWGYVGNEGPSDMALNLHYYRALEDMGVWERRVNGQDSYQAHRQEVREVITGWMKERLRLPGGWKNVGYHCSALALNFGLVEADEKARCVSMMKEHILSCFPNNPNGPRLSDPGVSNSQIITPYFGHWSMAALMKCGEADFVLDQYRKCWGWALSEGDQTWLEVFDTRWSHCHEWSGCPTWQLTRFVLGVLPSHADGFNFYPLKSSLKFAKGDVPFGEGGVLHVEWRRKGKVLTAIFTSNQPTSIWDGHQNHPVSPGQVTTFKIVR